ncbi:MAG TPA: hypothetical protein VFT12_13415 [Thermoanaerobaculia bacterium]|nr:hypothetical protein [Thermoanaerobaculia bacterium]
MIVTIVAGLLVVGIGTTLLFFAFRAVGEGRKGELRYVILAATLLVFVFLACAVIFMISFR